MSLLRIFGMASFSFALDEKLPQPFEGGMGLP